MSAVSFTSSDIVLQETLWLCVFFHLMLRKMFYLGVLRRVMRSSVISYINSHNIPHYANVTSVLKRAGMGRICHFYACNSCILSILDDNLD